MMDKNRSNQRSRDHPGKVTDKARALLATVSLLGPSLGMTINTSADAQALDAHITVKGGTKIPSGESRKQLTAPDAMRHHKFNEFSVKKSGGSETLTAPKTPSTSLTQPNTILGTGGVPAVTTGNKTGSSGTTKR
jgi:hypothetical protein